MNHLQLAAKELQINFRNMVVQAAEMAAVDSWTIQKMGIPGCVLMERAGMAVTRACRKYLARGRGKAVIVCGIGNNGGDGFVVARLLLERSIACKVVIIGDPKKIKGDAKLNLTIWRNLGQIPLPFNAEAKREISSADLLIDAMLGTGATGPLRPLFREASDCINQSPAKVIAVDLPTGLDADSGTADAKTVRANHTITFGAFKTGHLFAPGAELAGKVTVADIGFPPQAFRQIECRTFYLNKMVARQLVPKRKHATYKNKQGKVLIVAGSTGMSGAAALSCKAALTAGAGLIIHAGPQSIASIHDPTQPEIMKLPLTETDGKLNEKAYQQLETQLEWADVIAIGPGLGAGKPIQEITTKLAGAFTGLLIIDADGLNALAKRPQCLRERTGETILTPHIGEFCKLSGIEKTRIIKQPVQVAREFAQEHGVHLILKGAPSVCALPDGRVFVNSAGNPGMATAGMGDVLTGVIAGFGGQVGHADEAALLSLYIHSRAADLAAAQLGEISLTAGATIQSLPFAIQSTLKKRRTHYA